MKLLQYVHTVALTVLGAESDECPRCEVLQEELSRVIAEKNYLLQIALNRDDVISNAPEEEVDYQLLRPRKVPWSTKRKQVETQRRAAREKVEVKPELSEAEKIFEQELNNAGKVS